MRAGVKPSLVSRGRKEHGETAGVRRADEFFRVGAGAALETRSKRERAFVSAAAELHRAGAFFGVPFHSAEDVRMVMRFPSGQVD